MPSSASARPKRSVSKMIRSWNSVRHWVITDANGKVQEVSGDGVVGEQPHLQPGEEFRYSSGAVLETPVGAMQGLYRMEAEGGVNFDAPIAPFTLAVPGLLH